MSSFATPSGEYLRHTETMDKAEEEVSTVVMVRKKMWVLRVSSSRQYFRLPALGRMEQGSQPGRADLHLEHKLEGKR